MNTRHNVHEELLEHIEGHFILIQGGKYHIKYLLAMRKWKKVNIPIGGREINKGERVTC